MTAAVCVQLIGVNVVETKKQQLLANILYYVIMHSSGYAWGGVCVWGGGVAQTNNAN